MTKRVLITLGLLLPFFYLRLLAQSPLVTPATDTVRTVLIINADRMSGKKIDSTNELLILAGHVIVKDNNTLFYGDSVVHNKKLNILEAFGNVHINDSDSIDTRSQYLIYYIDKKQAVLKKKVSMTDGKGILTTDELLYDTQLKMGTYTNGGKVVNGKTVLTSKEATYYGDLKDVYFKQNVKLKDPSYDLTTDSLLYNTGTQIATFITETNIIDSNKSRIVTSDGYYNLKNKTARFGKRARIQDKALSITGEDIVIDDVSGVFEASGNAVLIDTSQGTSVLANYIRANRKTNTFVATQHPLMIIRQDKDSIYITADTLYSGRLTDLRNLPDSTIKKDSSSKLTVVNTKDSANRNRYFQAFHHVRIFTDSLQAISDSLFYSGRDSIFQLFNGPVLWANNKQVTGDTIYLYTKNKKAERIYVFENGMLVDKSGDDLFNQIKGNTLNGYFKNGDIDFMRAKGSAESVYYAKDEDEAFVGMTTTTADIIDMFFAEKALKRVVFRNDVVGTTYPVQQIPEDKKILRNFKWLEEKRPKTKFELFEDIIVSKK
ncbi:MAG: OstA-like protein [Chitinophagaceae bacterium]